MPTIVLCLRKHLRDSFISSTYVAQCIWPLLGLEDIRGITSQKNNQYLQREMLPLDDATQKHEVRESWVRVLLCIFKGSLLSTQLARTVIGHKILTFLDWDANYAKHTFLPCWVFSVGFFGSQPYIMCTHMYRPSLPEAIGYLAHFLCAHRNIL